MGREGVWLRRSLEEVTELLVMLSEPLSVVVCSTKSVEKLQMMSVKASEHRLSVVKGPFFLPDRVEGKGTKG